VVAAVLDQRDVGIVGAQRVLTLHRGNLACDGRIPPWTQSRWTRSNSRRACARWPAQ
jgi:hypothetical protein